MKSAARKVKMLPAKGYNLPLIEVTGSRTTWKGSPNDMVTLCLNSASELNEITSEFPCLVTGKPGLRIRTDQSTLCLTPDRVCAFFLTALAQEDYKAIHANSPTEWWIHGDFYNSQGKALQPKIAVKRATGKTSFNKDWSGKSTTLKTKPADTFDPFNL
jgi:hypothetical protein